MFEDTVQERQDNELAALQAIYGDDVVDNRKAMPWNVWRPLDVLLTLHPLHDSNVNDGICSITLHIKCCNQYPDKPPSISITKLQGISTENGTKLLAELGSLASQHCGEVMIFELSQHVQQFLHVHYKPTLSFYDEMLKEKKETELMKLQDTQTKEMQERQKIKEEIQKRQELLRESEKRVHRSSTSLDNSTEDQGHGDAPELVCYADVKMSPAKGQRNKATMVCTCSVRATQIVRISQRNNKKVYIGSCMGHSSNGAITYLAIEDETGERLITKKWSIPPATDFQTRTRQMNWLQQDLKTMSRLKHCSLVPYTFMETLKETKRTGRQSMFIFRDYVSGGSLKYLLSNCQYGDRFEALKLLRAVGVGVFSALMELHSVNVEHRDVRCENVFLDDFGGVKLVGAALDARLAEMQEGDSYCSKQTQAQDIYAAAQLLLSIISCEATSHEVPPELPSSAKDFFSRCLTDDEHSQWTAEQLVNHGFLVDAPVKQPDNNQKESANSGSEDDEEVKKIRPPAQFKHSHSRLHAEFDIITWLGKGAFGDVLKVKNKLDGGFYAIKRIKLNPESVQLNKKITREVKLLSRLNHENVVRYYNAWIESVDAVDETEEVEETVSVKTPVRKEEESLADIVAKLGQGAKVEWSMSEKDTQKNSSSDSEEEDDDEEDDEPDIFQILNKPKDESSCGIEFEEASNQSETIPSEDVTDTPRPPSVRLQFLYIQMEFCEKHTLRQAIDNGLYQEHFRAWRLFREIVEGLAHVHQRGMIHRDLKPVNIFLDSNDHVKIGDFGLATKAFTGLPVDEKVKPQEEVDGSLTGQVGTALYVAPELLGAVGKVIYNQKVDLYSLGIILFEMFHPPLSTGMERMCVLTELRTKGIVMPQPFEKEENSKQIHVIRWLLDHEPSQRPTCVELLASEHVPRPVPEGALSGLLAHTLNDRGTRCYQRLIDACLDQRLSAAEDFTFHSEIYKNRPIEVLDTLKEIVIKVFKSHGALEFSPPLLMPRSTCWDQYPNAVKVMTASGAVCHLPRDLRLPFARHIAYSGTKCMRRFVVDKVYREKHLLGFHPREMIECAFDIVTPKNESLWTDAELLMVAYRCASSSSLKVVVHLNHTQLLQALLLFCGVPLDKHADLYPVLDDVRFGRITSLQLQTHLTSLCVTDHDVTNLLRLMEADVPIEEVRELVTSFVRKSKWAKVVSRPLSEIEAVYRNAIALGCECQVRVAPFSAYNATQHSGVFWQMSVSRPHRKSAAKRRSGDVIAAGGRYDALVQEFWAVANDKKELNCCSVGFSMSLERMAAILKKFEPEVTLVTKNQESLVCVCVWGTAGSNADGMAAARRAQLARDLWALGLCCCVWPAGGGGGGVGGGGADAHEACGARVVLMQEDAAFRVYCWGNDRARELKVPYMNVIDVVKQNLNPEPSQSPEGTSNRTISWSENDKSSPNISVTFITASERMTKNSKRHCENQINTQVTSLLVSFGLQNVMGRVRVSVLALTCEAACVSIRHAETDVCQYIHWHTCIINTQVTSLLVSLGLQPVMGRVRVSVLALTCEAACVRALAAHLSVPLEHCEMQQACRPVFTSFPKRQNILDETLNELAVIAKQGNQSRSPEETQLYALYSISDSMCRLIT